MIDKSTKRPALIYSEHYDIDFMGLEKRYCFDMRKSRRIFESLRGEDALQADDFMGGFQMTREGIIKRDLMVFETARAAGIPLAVVTAGGYAEASWEIHLASIKAVLAVWTNDLKVSGT